MNDYLVCYQMVMRWLDKSGHFHRINTSGNYEYVPSAEWDANNNVPLTKFIWTMKCFYKPFFLT